MREGVDYFKSIYISTSPNHALFKWNPQLWAIRHLALSCVQVVGAIVLVLLEPIGSNRYIRPIGHFADVPAIIDSGDLHLTPAD